MKRLIIGLVSILGMLWATSAIADVEDKTVQVKLVVLQIIELDVTAPDAVVPTAEDYALKPAGYDKYAWVQGCEPTPDSTGFADRADALEVTTFTNAKSGATVYFYGNPNPIHEESLQNKDVYLSVSREKTYVLMNRVDDLAIDKSDLDAGYNEDAKLIDGAWAIANTSVDGDYKTKWIQANNEAREFFGVKEATEAGRLWAVKLGVACLSEYTENAAGYTMDLTFILMPRV
ncbi:MAG: hypothetical protein AB1414_09945 [bacterium]